MSIFDVDTTTDDESPDTGHEEESAEETENEQDQEEQDTDQEESEEDESPEKGQDDLLAGKFKTQEDLVKAYQNAQKKITELGMQSKQQPAPQPGQTQQPNNANVEEVFWEQFQNNPLGTMQYLIDNAVNQRTAPIFAREEQQTLASNMDPIAKEFKQVRTEEGMHQLFERIADIAQEMGNPKLADNPSPRILKMAAQELFGDGKAALVKNAMEAGRQAAEEARRNKQGVTVTTGSKRAPQDAPKTEADQVKENIRNASRSSGIFGL